MCSFAIESGELIALCECQALARSWGIQVVVAETDALNIVHGLKFLASCSYIMLSFMLMSKLYLIVLTVKLAISFLVWAIELPIH